MSFPERKKRRGTRLNQAPISALFFFIISHFYFRFSIMFGHALSQADTNKQQYEHTGTRGARQTSSTTPDDGSHPQHRPSPMHYSSWLKGGRVWACTQPLQSVNAAAELVCRRWVVVTSVGRVVCYTTKHYCIPGTCIAYVHKILYNRLGLRTSICNL